MKKDKISLITGAGGFIGANLVYRLLSLGHKVHIIVRPGANLWRLQPIMSDIISHEINVSNYNETRNVLEKVKPTNVFHLIHYGGNVGQDDINKIRQTIIEGTAIIYNACMGIESIKSIVNTGTSSEYGKKSEPMKENMLLEPNTEYGVAKTWATLYGQYCAREKRLPVITGRLFSVYGPYEHRNRFMTEVALACIRGIKPKLANPKTVRDFIYIDDAVDALITISEVGKIGRIYNVGFGQERSLEEAVLLIVKNTGFKGELSWGDYGSRSFDTDKWQADTSYTERELGWKAKINLEEGIKKTVGWFKKNIHFYENI